MIRSESPAPAARDAAGRRVDAPVGPTGHRTSTQLRTRRATPMASNITLNIGEALVGEGNEIAHIDLLIGSKTGPVGQAFANALTNQSKGHSNLLAVLTPNLICK